MDPSLRHDVLSSKLDLESGWSEATRARIHRFVFVRTRRLLIAAYIAFLSVVLVVACLQYVQRYEIYGLQPPGPSEVSTESTLVNVTGLQEPSLPRHPHYIIFEPPSSHISLDDHPLRPTSRLPEYCLESHIALGYPCSNNKPINFDIVWTWVNGTDLRFRNAMAEAAITLHPEIGENGKNLVASTSSPNSKLYRDHDELRHSFRSVLQHFRPYVKQFHLFTSDFPVQVDDLTRFPSRDDAWKTEPRHSGFKDETNADEDGGESTAGTTYLTKSRTLRMGQIPGWLLADERDTWKDGAVNIKVAHQAQVFRDYSGTSFNSYGIESQLPYLPNVEQNFIYLNDDFFFTADLHAADFFTSAYGPVLRMDPTLIVEPVPVNVKVSPAGEWGPLGYSSWLLSERFGTRGRPYPIHAAKSFSMPIMDEVARVWEAEFETTAAHKFRGGAGGDAYMGFLATHFLVERWREALLWAWVVGRIGGDDDEWGVEQQEAAWLALGGDVDDVDREVRVVMTERRTVEEDRVADALRASGNKPSARTAYTFSSADGYPYGYRTRRDKMTWPRFSGEHIGQPLCTINFDACIGARSFASEAFKTIAFEKPQQCGDCIIHALRSASGVLGLSAFLPAHTRTFKPSVSATLYDQLLQSDVSDMPMDDEEIEMDDDDVVQEGASVPHLPLVRNWGAGDFTLGGVLDPYGAMNVRAWTMRLLERYRFIIGDTSIVFLMIDSPKGAFAGLKSVTSDVALLCMNDDVGREPEATDKILRDWQGRRWGHPARWER